MLTGNSSRISLGSEERQHAGGISSEEKLPGVVLLSLHPKQGKAAVGKISIFRPYPVPAGKFWFHCPQPQQLWHPRTPSCVFHAHPWCPFQLPIPEVSLLGWAFHSFSLVPDSLFISFIWSWFFSWEERGNNCLGATHDFVDVYHNCIISASSLGFMEALDVIFGAFVCSHSHCHRAHIHADFALEFFPLVFTRTLYLYNKLSFSWLHQ